MYSIDKKYSVRTEWSFNFMFTVTSEKYSDLRKLPALDELPCSASLPHKSYLERSASSPDSSSSSSSASGWPGAGPADGLLCNKHAPTSATITPSQALDTDALCQPSLTKYPYNVHNYCIKTETIC